MLLSVLAAGFTVQGADRDVTSITDDSRKVTAGGLFVAVSGTAEDGHAYIHDALRRGARVIVAERIESLPDTVARIEVRDSRKALAMLAARFYGAPGSELELVGFTGTFGKTSTSEVLRSLLSAAGGRPGVLGSLGARYQDFRDADTSLTTPAPVELHRALRGLRDAGAGTVIMEVTSHALRMQRVAGLTFSGGLLAAIKPGEHTDFHRTYEDYLAAKRLFLDYLAPDATLAYDDDNRGARELAAARQSGRSVGFSLDGRSTDLVFADVTLDASGARFSIDGPLAGGRHQLSSALLGTGHLRNVALALTYGLARGIDLASASKVLASLQPLPRRMERYAVMGRTVLDDTAAHPDSFRSVFAVGDLLPHERLIVVYAIRGNRGTDINSRNAEALADLAAEHFADALIVTTSSDAAADVDRVSPDELSAACGALGKRGREFVLHHNLSEAVADALDRSRPGDLIILIGAQGMNQGKRLILSSADTAART